MHDHSPERGSLRSDENISRTIPRPAAAAKAAPPARPCRYIATATWRAGAPPYCGEPALPGSAYCARHAPLCAVDPASKAGGRLAAAQDLAARAGPPPALAHLAAIPLLEALEEDEDETLRREMPPRPSLREEEP